MKKTGFILMLLLVVCPIASTALALEIIAEARFESVQGKPLQEELRFSSLGYEDIVLAVQNGAQDGADRVSSAVINLNGVKVLQPSDFSQKVTICNVSLFPMTWKMSWRSACGVSPAGISLFRSWVSRP